MPSFLFVESFIILTIAYKAKLPKLAVFCLDNLGLICYTYRVCQGSLPFTRGATPFTRRKVMSIPSNGPKFVLAVAIVMVVVVGSCVVSRADAQTSFPAGCNSATG